MKALLRFFTFVGLPKSVQSDQGSNFMSGVLQLVMHQLGIKQFRHIILKVDVPFEDFFRHRKYDKVLLL